MQATLLKIHPENPQPKAISMAVDVLKKGGLVIYPTDTIYGLGCDLHNLRAVERLCQLRGINVAKAQLSFICHDLTHISDYAKISTQTFKIMKKALPGPFTFVLEASGKVPKIGGTRRKTVGIRIPDNQIALRLVEELGNPIISTSIKDEDEVLEYTTDPELIYEKYENLVDLVIDGGYGNNKPSTVINCENDAFEILRQGAGDISEFL